MPSKTSRLTFLRSRISSSRSTASAAGDGRATSCVAGASRRCPGSDSPLCARCGAPTAFETFVCEGCKGVDFGFDGARAPLRYEGVGEEIVHALKYRGYTRVVDGLAAPLMLGVLDRGERFDGVVPVPLHRSRLRRRGLQPGRVAGAWRRGGARGAGLGYTKGRAQDQGSGRALGGRAEGQRRRSLRAARAGPREDPSRRRRVHDGGDDELLRRDSLAGRGRGGSRLEPVQDMLAVSSAQRSAGCAVRNRGFVTSLQDGASRAGRRFGRRAGAERADS